MELNKRQIELAKIGVDSGMTRKEVANFVAQASHESYNLTRLNEGFRYTKGIQQITTKTPSALRNGKHELEVARQEALHGKTEHLAELMYGVVLAMIRLGTAGNIMGVVIYS